MRVTRPALPVLCLLTSALLLGGCSKKATEEDVPVAQEQTQAAADGEAAEMPSPPPLDLWPYVAPLVAGSYAGECTQLPEAKTAQSAIALAPNGKASAPGIEGDIARSTTMMLVRRLESDGSYYATANLDVKDGPSMQFMDQNNGKIGMVVLSDGKRQLSCQHGSPIGKLNSQPLHAAFAKLIDVGGQTLQCRNLDNPLVTRDVEVRVGGGALTVAGQKIELAKVTNETIILGDGNFNYSIALPGQSGPLGPSLHYDAAGKLKAASQLPVDGKEHQCERAD